MVKDQFSIQDDLRKLHKAVGKLQPADPCASPEMKTAGLHRFTPEAFSRNGPRPIPRDLSQYATRSRDPYSGYPAFQSAYVERVDYRIRPDLNRKQEHAVRQKFWVSLALSIPALMFSPSLQGWLGYSLPAFAGSRWITPMLAMIVFLYGGLPFLQMARAELQNHDPGTMTLISSAILVAFVYCLVALFLPILAGSLVFWELVSLIDILLLGYWIEMRGARHSQMA
jgi:cation transport ATPase